MIREWISRIFSDSALAGDRAERSQCSSSYSPSIFSATASATPSIPKLRNRDAACRSSRSAISRSPFCTDGLVAFSGLQEALLEVGITRERSCVGGVIGSGKSVTALSVMRLLHRRRIAGPKALILLDGADVLKLNDEEMRRCPRPRRCDDFPRADDEPQPPS